MAWDSNKPADNELMDNVASVIRDNQDATYDTIEVDHYPMDNAEIGKHKQVTLKEISDPSAATDTGFVYVKNDGTKTEAYFRGDASGSAVQLTKGKYPYGSAGAYCVFNGTQSTPISPTNSLNVTNITKSSTGVYQVNFTSDFADSNYIANVFMNGSTPSMTSINHVYYVETFEKNKSYFKFTVKRLNLITTPSIGITAIDSDNVNVVVYRNS